MCFLCFLLLHFLVTIKLLFTKYTAKLLGNIAWCMFFLYFQKSMEKIRAVVKQNEEKEREWNNNDLE